MSAKRPAPRRRLRPGPDAGAPGPRQLAEHRAQVLRAAVARMGRGGADGAAAVAADRARTWRAPVPPPGVVPPKFKVAMDEALNGYSDWAMAQQSMFAEGLQFLGYPYLAELSQRPEYRVISETWAQEMTRKWIKLISTGDAKIDDKTDKLKQIEAELERLKAKEAFKEAAEKDGFFGRSHIYLDMGVGYDDRDELKQSIGEGGTITKAKLRKRPLKHLRVIEPVWTYPNSYNAINPLAGDFFKPSTWFVMGREIHATRMLTFVGRPVSDLLKPAYSFGGLSLSQMCKPYVDNWLRTRQSVSDAISNFSIMMLLTDMSSMLDQGATVDLELRAELFNITRDNRGLMMGDKDAEDLKNVSMPLGSLDHLQAQSQEHMAAVSQIPLVKLTGIAPSGLNASSEGEIQVFYDKVEAQQVSYLGENLTKLLNFVQLSLYGEVDPEISYVWNSLQSADPAEESTKRKTDADTDTAYINAGVVSPQEVRVKLASDEDSPYASLDTSPDSLPADPNAQEPGAETDEYGQPMDAPEGGQEGEQEGPEGPQQTPGAVGQGMPKVGAGPVGGNEPGRTEPVAPGGGGRQTKKAPTLSRDSASFVLLALDEAFEESEHPRDADGKFSVKGSVGVPLMQGFIAAVKDLKAGKSPELDFSDTVKDLLKAKGFKKGYGLEPNPYIKGWLHPSGVGIFVGPGTGGKKFTSTWISTKKGKSEVVGPGSKELTAWLQEALAEPGESPWTPIPSAPAEAVTPAEEGELAGHEEHEIEGSKPGQKLPPDPAAGGMSQAKQKEQALNAFAALSGSGYAAKAGTWHFTSSPSNKVREYTKGADTVLFVAGGPEAGHWVSKAKDFVMKTGYGVGDLAALLSGDKSVLGKLKNMSGTTDPKQAMKEVLGIKPPTAEPENPEHHAPKKGSAAYTTYQKLSKHIPKPTGAEQDSIEYYTGSGYVKLNQGLRHEPGYAAGSNDTKQLTAYLDRAEFPEEMSLQRKVGSEYAKILRSIMVEGTTFIDRGFVSMSTGGNWSGSLKMHIKVPKGAKAAACGSIGSHPSEDEVIAQRGSVFKVVKFDRKQDEVFLELLPPVFD